VPDAAASVRHVENSIANRLHYLDTIRGLLMSLGVVVHAGLLYRHWVPHEVAFLSGLFRMKLFVIIAGYFAALLVARRGVGRVQKERLIRFGVPFAAGIILLNPIANYFYYLTSVGDISVIGFFSTPPAWTKSGFAWAGKLPTFMSWHSQYWFLLVVLAYCCMLPLFKLVADSKIVRQRISWLVDDQRPVWLCGVVLSICSALGLGAMRGAHLFTTQQFLGSSPLNFLAQSTWLYMPYFLLGMLAFNNAKLFDRLHEVRWLQVCVSVLILAITRVIYADLKASYGMGAAEAVEHFASGLAGFWLSVIVLSFFRKVGDRPSPLTKYLSDASYTVFVFHIVVLSILQYMFLSAGISGFAMYLALMITAFMICLLIHLSLISRSPIAKLLFNGANLPRSMISPHVVN
jgi:glucan biosynthesis protein C